MTTLAPQLLLERLAAEYVYAQLCEAAMHSFEAENEARMMAMALAKTNIETKLAGLCQRGALSFADEITTEIVELARRSRGLTEQSYLSVEYRLILAFDVLQMFPRLARTLPVGWKRQKPSAAQPTGSRVLERAETGRRPELSARSL